MLLEKFQPTWSDYRNHLNTKEGSHNARAINHMRIEEANCLKDKKNSVSSIFVKANLVESTAHKETYNKGMKFQKGVNRKIPINPKDQMVKSKKIRWLVFVVDK